MKYWKHFKTVTKHKWYVMKACFKTGIFLQGFLHDLSKFSFTEFIPSARYFQGDKSPNKIARIENGYSIAWQHHMGVNKHHWEYWIDFEGGNLLAVEIPTKYLQEMICDWIGAGKAYNKDNWTIDTFKGWYENSRDKMILHNNTREFIDLLMDYVRCEEDIYKIISKKNIKEHMEFSNKFRTPNRPTVYKVTRE